MRDFLLRLPLLYVNPNHEIDYAACDPEVLLQIASNAEICQRTIQFGVSAIGHLMARGAPEIKLAKIPGDFVEALGWCLTEMGDMASVAQCLAAACRRFTSDYTPKKRLRVSKVRP